MRPVVLALLDLLFPPACVYCGKSLKDARLTHCAHCKEETFWLSPTQEAEAGQHFSRCISAASYQDGMRRALLLFKFQGKRHYAKAFAAALAPLIGARFAGEFDLVTWIPVSKKTLKTRGYDQAQLLAQAVAQLLDMPAAPTLVQLREKRAQSGIANPTERRENVKDLFGPLPGAPIQGRRLLLMDDVFTTGATLEAGARALWAAGAAGVLCATFCRTPKGAPVVADEDLPQQSVL